MLLSPGVAIVRGVPRTFYYIINNCNKQKDCRKERASGKKEVQKMGPGPIFHIL